jgi:hypothetical protein
MAAEFLRATCPRPGISLGLPITLRHNRWRMRLIRLLALMLVLAAAPVRAQTGASFLRLGVGARAAGMGEAYTAAADDATAAYWNPAGLLRVDRRQVTFFHNEWFQDIRSEFFALVLPGHEKAVALALNSTNTGDIEIRGNQPTPEPDGTFAAHDLVLSVSYARRLKPKWDFGITLKYLYQKIFLEESSGLAGDFGLRYRFQDMPLALAATVQNLGFMSKLRDESPELPRMIRLGAVYEFAAAGAPGWTAAADWVTDWDGNSHLHIGAEVILRQRFALRSGYQTGYEFKNVHFGLGLNLGNLLFDYGYVPLQQDFGQGHRLAVTYLF